MTINELIREAHGTARDKGWWNSPQPAAVYHMLFVTEIAEATEAARLGREPEYTLAGSAKPEGELTELADVLIRIADYCGANGWDLEGAVKRKLEYNKTRPHRHGGKEF